MGHGGMCLLQLRDIVMMCGGEDAGEEVKVFVFAFKDMLV
jgi:hypothetical protein